MTTQKNANAPHGQDPDPSRRRAVCEHCGRAFSLPEVDQLPACPYCFQATLAPTDWGDAPSNLAVERLLPFGVSADTFRQQLQAFSSGFWFVPHDLRVQNLLARQQRIFLPMWLVDSDVQAQWTAEAGFDYEVVSHRDQYDEGSGGWRSQQITETRVRWEPRVGSLQRRYHNIAAPALEDHGQLMGGLGRFDLAAGQPPADSAIDSAAVVLPDRAPEDAWQDAVPVLHATGAEECGRAAGADHIRDFQWSAQFGNHNWTQVLLPVYASYYRDDDRRIQALLIHGQTGQVFGRQRASMRRARRLTLVVGAASLALFAISLLAILANLIPAVQDTVDGGDLMAALGVLGIMAAFALAIVAIIPVAYVWFFNRQGGQQP